MCVWLEMVISLYTKFLVCHPMLTCVIVVYASILLYVFYVYTKTHRPFAGSAMEYYRRIREFVSKLNPIKWKYKEREREKADENQRLKIFSRSWNRWKIAEFCQSIHMDSHLLFFFLLFFIPKPIIILWFALSFLCVDGWLDGYVYNIQFERWTMEMKEKRCIPLVCHVKSNQRLQIENWWIDLLFPTL